MQEEILNLEIRKFLKKVGITSQREIEQKVRDLAASGVLEDGPLEASMHLSVPALGLDLKIDGLIRTSD